MRGKWNTKNKIEIPNIKMQQCYLRRHKFNWERWGVGQRAQLSHSRNGDSCIDIVRFHVWRPYENHWRVRWHLKSFLYVLNNENEFTRSYVYSYFLGFGIWLADRVTPKSNGTLCYIGENPHTYVWYSWLKSGKHSRNKILFSRKKLTKQTGSKLKENFEKETVKLIKLSQVNE